jgi:flagellar assembly protein FliH
MTGPGLSAGSVGNDKHMTKPTKFTFGNVFDLRDSVGKRGIAASMARPRHFDEDAMAASFARGRAEGAREAYAEIEARIANAFEVTASQMRMLLERQSQLAGQMKRDAAVLAEMISKQLAPALMRQKPLAEFEALIEECIAEIHEEPCVVVRVSPSLVEPMKDKVAALASRLNPSNEVTVTGDPSLSDMDCRVEWSDGGIERDYERLEALISEAVHRFVGQTMNQAVTPIRGEIETEPRT